MQTLDALIEENAEELLDFAKQLIRIESVKDSPAPGCPFGAKIGIALALCLDTCQKLGLRTKNCNGYAGWAEYGQGEECVGVLVHLDVVPAGTGWNHPPFGGEVLEGKLYGRGAIDDKGPAAAAIYALAALRASGLPLTKRLRIIFGTDEENQWGCMEYYKQTGEEIPACSFAPDAEYPVIHAEKGILFANILGGYAPPAAGLALLQLKGGAKPNMVPDACKARLRLPAELKSSLTALCEEFGAELRLEESEALLETKGVGAHASTPEKGENAIAKMMALLARLPWPEGGQKAFIRFFNEKIGNDLQGRALCGEVQDEVSGALVLNAGVAEVEGGEMRLELNLRYPVSWQGEDLLARIARTAEEFGLQAVKILDSAPLYRPADDPMVQGLLAVFRQYCPRDTTPPLLIGGGTYARAMPHAVAFGPLLPGQEELAHCADEYIGVADLILNTKIYAEAMRRLAE